METPLLLQYRYGENQVLKEINGFLHQQAFLHLTTPEQFNLYSKEELEQALLVTWP